MSYTYDVSNTRGKVRLLTGDITVDLPIYRTNYVFEDADIDALLDLNSEDVWAATADACRRLAADEVLGAVRLSLNGMSLDKTQVPKYWLDMAKTYDKKSAAGDVVEFVDSVAYNINEFGEDESEYVGDII